MVRKEDDFLLYRCVAGPRCPRRRLGNARREVPLQEE